MILGKYESLPENGQCFFEIFQIDHTGYRGYGSADALDVDRMIPQGFEHMPGDHLAFFKVETGYANQGYFWIMNDRLAAYNIMNDLCDFKSGFKIFSIDTNKDVIEFVAIKKVDDQFNMNA